jgi:p38 MAP kinase
LLVVVVVVVVVVVWSCKVADAEPDFHNLGDISQNEAEGPITGEVPPAASS